MAATIEYIEQVVSSYGQATEANWDTPGRDGNVIVLDEHVAEDVVITGDLHGHRRNFTLIRRVMGLDKHPKRHLVLQEVCHGGPTYPTNGGCMSHTMLEDVARLKVQYPDRVHFILGNHELAEMTDYPIQKNRQMLNLAFRLGMQEMYGVASERVREVMFAFLRSCPLAVRLPGGVFVSHSLPERCDGRRFEWAIFKRRIDPVEYYERSAVFDLVWGRDYRQENADAFARMVEAGVLITGHEPCPEGFCTPNQTQIILDCCGDQAAYVVLPIEDRPWSQAEIVERIRKLG
jgi:hypothetical protein